MILRSPARVALALCCQSYLVLGLVIAAIGPLLPEFAAGTSASLAAVGALFTALAFGGLLSQLASGPISDRIGTRPILLVSSGLLAAGLAGLAVSRSLPVMLGCGFIAGTGHGAVDVGANVMVATSFTGRKVSALNFLHLFFGLGAVLGPAAVSISLRLWGTGLPALWLCVAMLILQLPLMYRLMPSTMPHILRPEGVAGKSIYLSTLLWVFAAMLGVYVGVELGMGGWTTTYLGETAGLAVAVAALVTSGYWLALTTGRLISTIIGTRWSGWRVLIVDLAGALLAGVILFVAPVTWAAIASILLMGLSFGSIYPTIMALTTAQYSNAPGKSASVIAAAGSLGGMLFPLLQGILLIGRGPEASILFVCAGILTMLVLYLVARSLAHAGPHPSAALSQ